ncbi:V-type ATP synthase subunit C [Gymnopus androsaceus JB14]|uniref:V-type ATP synthase subunit C n=1 Tax=Gymnopus androsaceus JB14 TaxID=1447944 RepID=A0A6A4HCS7_9AGAR|nr:V-type ATP synthase subunit C [Gymnopus androsaceus JB14]
MNESHYASLEVLHTQLSATDYGNFLANEPLPISTATIAEKATQILVDQFKYLRNNAVEPLSKYGYMIDNVIPLITGTLYERDTHELIERCHPLGVFESMPALCVPPVWKNYTKPLLPRLTLCLRPRRPQHRNHPKHRLQSLPRRLLLLLPLPRRFHLGRHDPHPLLRGRSTTLNITINSFNSDLSKEERAKLFPNIGRLFPEWNNQLAKADEIDQVRMVCENVGEYRQFFSDAGAHEAPPTGTTQAVVSSPNC